MSAVPLADYHIHTTLCHHAEGSVLDYLERASDLGLEEIGFACHSPMREYFDEWRMAYEDLPRYFAMVELARARGTELGIRVRLGLEVDYLPGHETWIEELSGLADWDYFIGSVHYLSGDLVVDHPEHLSRLREWKAEEVWDRYWRLFGQAARSGLFDFMAHPDLPKKFGIIPEGELGRFYESAVIALSSAKIGIEINTAGLRKDIRQAYPTLEFLRLAREAKIPLSLNSDAHKPEEVGFAFDHGLALARQAGYAKLSRYARRQCTSVPI